MIITRFLQFVNENQTPKLTVPLQFSRRFMEVLGDSGYGIISPIKDALIQSKFSPQNLSLIDIGRDPDTASFTTGQKLLDKFKTTDQQALNGIVRSLNREDSLIYSSNRTEIKIGRLIKRLFLDTFSDSEIEKFVNQYKALLDQNSTKFEIYRGSEIKTGYASKRYTYTAPQSNALMNSCMNDCLDWVDFYEGCPNVFLLVLVNDDNHIFGRALVWKIGDRFLMDRVYVAFEKDYYKFTDYAKARSWWWKDENRSDPSIPYTNGKIVKWFKIEVKMNFNFDSYKEWGVPYMDTLCYIKGDTLMNYIPSGNYYKLQETDGNYVEVESEDVEYEEI